jgi:integrase
VRQRLDAVFEDAIFHGLCASNPAAAIRRKMREAGGKRERGELTALPFREAPAFMKTLRLQAGTAARTLEFAVLTASRTSEALFACWPEFDLAEGLWRIPAERMKSGEVHTVHLSERTLDILRAQVGQHGSIVFPSTLKADSPQSNMAMLAVLDRMDMRDRTTVHGLCRATFSTWANETGAARPDVVEACLAHREADRVKAAYNRAKFSEERKALMIAWGEYLTRAMAEVLPLRAA